MGSLQSLVAPYRPPPPPPPKFLVPPKSIKPKTPNLKALNSSTLVEAQGLGFQPETLWGEDTGKATLNPKPYSQLSLALILHRGCLGCSWVLRTSRPNQQKRHTVETSHISSMWTYMCNMCTSIREYLYASIYIYIHR